MSEKELLDHLAELQAQRTLAELDKQVLIDSVLTPEIKAKLSDIDAEFADKVEVVDARIAEATNNIKQAIIRLGETVKGEHLQAVYMKGRVSWDTKTLDGLAIVMPQLNQARKEGEPSVSIRKVN
jgi:hypothetical protein